MTDQLEFSPEIVHALALIVVAGGPTGGPTVNKLRRTWHRSKSFERAMLVAEALVAGLLLERSGEPQTESESRALYAEFAGAMQRLVPEIGKEARKIRDAAPLELIGFEDPQDPRKTLQ